MITIIFYMKQQKKQKLHATNFGEDAQWVNPIVKAVSKQQRFLEE